MTVLWSALLPDVLPHVRGCPSPIAEHELLRAAQRLFNDSRAWRITTDPAAVAADQDEVTIETGDSSLSLVRVEDAWYDGKELSVFTGDQMAREYGDDWMAHTGTPEAIIQDVPGVVRLYPVPTDAAATGIKFRISVKPSESSTGIPDNLALEYRDSLVSGAKSMLMLYPRTDWYAPDIAMREATNFQIDIERATLKAARSYGRGRIAGRVRWC